VSLNKKHIYIPIEIFVREINPKVLFAFKAAIKGYRVYLGTKTGIDKLINKKIEKNNRSGFYFYKSQLIKNKNYIYKIKKAIEKFIVLDEELGVGVSNIKPTINRRVKNLDNVDKFFVIGNQMKKNLINYDKNYKIKTHVSGWLKYDIYHKKNLKLFDEEVKKIKEKYGKFYLFSSNYGALSNKGLNERTKNDPSLKHHRKQYNKNNDYYTFKQSICDFNYLKKKLFKFLKNNPDMKFIIRPHPADRMYDDWKVFEKFHNVEVINKYDIVPWIIASKGLIHRGCTTAIDAFFLKKPTFYFLPKRQLLKSEKNLVYKISNKISDLDLIKNNSHKYNKGTHALVNKEIYSNQPAGNIILNELNKFNITKEKNITFNIYENFINYFIPFCGKIKTFLKNNLIGINILPDSKMSYFIDTKTLVTKIKALNINNKNITIKKITREVFEIEKK
jgi:surface carbohydrate biosynthesis protein